MKKEHSVKEFSGPIPSVKHEFYHAQLISVSSRKRGKSRTKKIKNITHHTTDLTDYFYGGATELVIKFTMQWCASHRMVFCLGSKISEK